MSHPPASPSGDGDETLPEIRPEPRREPTESGSRQRSTTATFADVDPAALLQGSPAWLRQQGGPAEGRPSRPPPPPPPPPPPFGTQAQERPEARAPLPRPPDPIGEMRRQEVAEAPAEAPPAAAPAPKVAPAITELLWYERSALPLVRRVEPWGALLDQLTNDDPDPTLDDASFSDSPAAMEDRRDIFDVLSRGAATDVAGTRLALERAVRDDGKLVPPLAMVEGDLHLDFDDLATLEAELALVGPLASGDEALTGEVKLIRTFLEAQDGDCAPQMVEMLSRRLWDAYDEQRRMVRATTLQQQAESVLRRRRRYPRREVFGGEQIRARLVDAMGDEIVVYLPSSMMNELPLYRRFGGRIIGRVHIRVDAEEDAPTALQALALARRLRSLDAEPRRRPPSASSSFDGD